MASLRLPSVAIALASLLPLLAHAAPAPSAEQAAILQQQTQKWLSDVSGGFFKVAPDTVMFAPEGDHYVVTVPLRKIGAVEPPDAAFTAKAHMIDDTRWGIDDQKFPPSFRITIDQPVPDAPDPKHPGAFKTHPETVTYVVTIGDQTSHATFDPTYATPTSSESTITAFDLRMEGGPTPSSQHWDHYAAQNSLRPTTPGRTDLLSDVTIDGVTSTGKADDGRQVRTTARRLHVIGSMTGLDRTRLTPLMGELVSALKDNTWKNVTSKSPAEQAVATAHFRKLLALAHELLVGGRLEEDAEGVAIDVGGHAGFADKFTFIVGADAPQDMLSGAMTFGLDGLTVPELPPAFAAYLPKHILVTPTFSNLSAADLTRMADAEWARAASPGAAPSHVDAASLFSHGGIVLGLDALALDIAGAQFNGVGKFTMTAPNAVSGQAEVTAHGLEALISQAQADPLLASGVPMLIFLKGIAHTTGDQAVWQIAVANKKMTVNGVDMSALARGLQ